MGSVTYRIAASAGYAGTDVGVEIDVHFVTDLVPSDSSPTGWRRPDGTFASAPDINEEQILERASQVRQTAARNVRSRELARSIAEADLSIEDWEEVEQPPTGDTRETVRIDPDGDGDGWVEYDADPGFGGGNLERRR